MTYNSEIQRIELPQQIFHLQTTYWFKQGFFLFTCIKTKLVKKIIAKLFLIKIKVDFIHWYKNPIKNYARTHTNFWKFWNRQRLLIILYRYIFKLSLSHCFWANLKLCKLKKLHENTNDSWPLKYKCIVSSGYAINYCLVNID